MRIIIFFDLPTSTVKNKKDYQKFSKFLKNQGFIKMQFSIYSKVVLNQSATNKYRRKIYLNSPNDGNIRMLIITEKQYASIEFITGKLSQEEKINNDRRIIKLWF